MREAGCSAGLARRGSRVAAALSRLPHRNGGVPETLDAGWKHARPAPRKMHPPRIELGSPAWQARILPLDHGCVMSVKRTQKYIYCITLGSATRMRRDGGRRARFAARQPPNLATPRLAGGAADDARNLTRGRTTSPES